MLKLPIGSLLISLILTILTTGNAYAEDCASEISSRSAPGVIRDHLITAANRQCDRVWQGTLPRSGVAAEIMMDTSLPENANLVSQVRRGLEKADEALVKLGSDVHIITPAHGPIGSSVRANSTHQLTVILASTNLTGDARDADAYADLLYGDCYLVIVPRSHDLLDEAEAMAFIMAHELFHCVQNATLSDFNIATSAKWWVESSAHWFAHLAIPTHVVETYSNSANEFERESGDDPFREFDYSLWPFFAWVAQDEGNASAVMRIMERMPEGEHSDEDVAGLYGSGKWDEFAKKYSAYQIRISPRVAVNPRPRVAMKETEIELSEVGDEQDYSFARRTAALDRYKITLKAGDYELSTTATDSMFLSEFGDAGDPDGNWIEISQPAGSLSLSVPCGEDKSYALVGVSAESPASEFTLTAKLVDETCTCTDLLPTGRDMCVIGIWEDQGPSEEYLTATPTTTESNITPVDSFYSDGSYTRDTQLRQVNESGPVTVTTTLDVSQALGSWGTSGNKLTICETRQITQGTVHSVGSGLDLTIPLNTDSILDPERYTKYTYTCDDSTLTLKRKILLFTPYGENLTFRRQ